MRQNSQSKKLKSDLNIEKRTIFKHDRKVRLVVKKFGYNCKSFLAVVNPFCNFWDRKA